RVCPSRTRSATPHIRTRRSRARAWPPHQQVVRVVASDEERGGLELLRRAARRAPSIAAHSPSIPALWGQRPGNPGASANEEPRPGRGRGSSRQTRGAGSACEARLLLVVPLCLPLPAARDRLTLGGRVAGAVGGRDAEHVTSRLELPHLDLEREAGFALD